jgi:hypothetical protein
MNKTIEVVTSDDTTIKIVIPHNIKKLTIIVKNAPQTSHKNHNKTKLSNTMTTIPSNVTNAISNVQKTTKTNRRCLAKPFSTRWIELQHKHTEKLSASSIDEVNDDDDNSNNNSSYVYELESNTEVNDDDDNSNDDSSYIYESESNTDSESSL